MSDEQLLVTHNSKFHADDVFAIATLGLLLEQNNKHWQVIRTRDPEDIGKGDYVVDVGGVYDADADRFDHHQIGGAGKRDNSIPYASFGLVWKKYGETISGNREVAEKIDQKLVQPIDALDSGITIINPIFDGLYPYGFSDFINALTPSWKENYSEIDILFNTAVKYAQAVLVREIKRASDKFEARAIVRKVYAESSDKRVIIFDTYCPANDFISAFPEPLFIISPKEDGTWIVHTVRDNPELFVNRKSLPENWAGKRDAELEQITGVTGSIFCHTDRFIAVAQTKESAIKLAELALGE